MTAPISRAEWEKQRREATEVVGQIADEVGFDGVLLGYQKRVVGLLNSVSTQVLFVEKSRRIGLTWGLAAYAVLRAGKEKKAGGMDVMYISYSKEMTREFIDACAMWARAFSIAALAEEEFLFKDGDDEGDRSIQAFRIPFASGFEIMGLSSAPRGLRGKQGVVIIDEAAFVDDLELLIEAAMAFLMWGGQVVVCSTHFGTENPFNVYIQDMLAGRKPGEHMRIDLDDALRDGLYERICLVSGKEWTVEGEAEWRDSLIDFYSSSADQELFCVPSQGAGTWLAGPLIEARQTETTPILRYELPANFLQLPELERATLLAPMIEEIEQELYALSLDPRYALGFDVARVADLSVIPLLAIEQNLKRRQALCLELRAFPFAEQRMIMEMIIDHLRERMVGIAVDATGMGSNIAEDLGRKYGLRIDETGAGLVHAIKFSQEWYRVNMPPLKAAFEDDGIAIAKDADHQSDLRGIKTIRGIASVPPTRTSENGKKGKLRHCDYAVGLALAYFATRMPWSEYSYRAVKAPETAQTGRMNDRPRNDDRQRRGWLQGALGARLRGRL